MLRAMAAPPTAPGRPSRARRRAIAALAILAVLLFGRGRADAWFFWPDGAERVFHAPGEFGLVAEDCRFGADDGVALHGLMLKATGPRRGFVVFCHGNAANVSLHLADVRWLPRCGFDVLLFDYRGYGHSEGTPTREGLVADACAAIDLALTHEPRRTLVFGHSLGGAIAILAAAERPAVRALVVESSFPRWRDAARAQAPALAWLVPWLVSGGREPIDALPRIAGRPLLIVHGDADHILPLALGEELFRAAAEPKRFHRAHGSGHATPWRKEGAAFEALVTDFFVDALAR